MQTSAHLVDVFLMYDPVHYQKETTSCRAAKWNKAIEQWPKSLRLLLLIPNKIFALILLLHSLQVPNVLIIIAHRHPHSDITKNMFLPCSTNEGICSHIVKKSLFVTVDPSENKYITTHIDK
jgi:hypothetical protein